MPRSIGYNVIGWNEAPWAKSGYYAASDSQAATFDVTTPVSDSQAAAFDVTTPIGDAQDTSYEIRQIAADSQAASFDVTNPAMDSQIVLFDVTNPCPAASRSVRYGVAMFGSSANAVLTKTASHGNLTRRRGDAVLTQTNP